jgi:DoxX-like family
VGALATWQHSACYALVVMFVFTGIAHFNKMKHDLARMVPTMFPRPLLLVYFTGLLEFMGAVGLLLPRFRSVAGICLIVLLIAIFPRQRERGDERNDVGWQAGHRVVAAGSHAGALYRSAVVVHASMKKGGLRKDRVNHEDGFRRSVAIISFALSGLCRFPSLTQCPGLHSCAVSRLPPVE